MALMGEMMSAISHQWRQPLNALALEVQDVREAYAFGELDKAYIENNIKNSMEKINFLSDTINNFRDYFKPQAEKEKFMVSDALKEVGTIIEEELRHHRIRMEISGGDFEIDGFKKNLSQVFLNILTNAKDAIDRKKADNPSYDGLISINVDAVRREIIIEDNGGGIPGDIIDKVFNPYFSTKFAAQGIGIGLYMSKMIIEKHHGGTIRVENSKEGARFIIKLS
jgi:signal transduction histidine kinase